MFFLRTRAYFTFIMIYYTKETSGCMMAFVLALLQLGRMEQKKYMCNCVAQLILSLPFFIAVSPRNIYGN